MNKRLRLCVIVVFVAGIGHWSLSARSAAAAVSSTPAAAADKQAPEKTAEQVYKNIQALKGVPASELQMVMAIFTGALGVTCDYCHISPFDKDDRPAKQTARRMIQMVLDLNRANFGGRGAITCYTCHRGSTKPEAVLRLGQNLWLSAGPPAGSADASSAEPSGPTPDQILDRYVQALGGREALSKLTTRISLGSRVGADGVLVPEEVYQKAPDKLLVITTYPRNSLRVVLNGRRGWTSSNNGVEEMGGDQLAELVREATFHKELSLKELYSEMAPAGKSMINDQEVYLIDAKSTSGERERLYFDMRSGLLVRRYRESKTVLGPFPLQTDYEDYEMVDGVKIPLTIRWSMPGRTWGRRIAEVKHQVPIEDEKFNPPAAKR